MTFLVSCYTEIYTPYQQYNNGCDITSLPCRRNIQVVSEQNKIKIQTPNVIKLYITSVNSMTYFVMINWKTTSSCSSLHVGFVILCFYETPWKWQLGVETCSNWHFTWSVFCDSCYIAFYSVYFVG